jgi:hypothetical protein
MPDQRITFADFRGMDQRTPADQLGPQVARSIQNLYLDRGALRLRSGRSKHNSSEVSGGAVQGLHKYYPISGTDKVLIVVGGKLYHASAGTFTEVKDTTAPTPQSLAAGSGDVHFVTFNDKVYFVSGSGGPWYYDGTNWFLINAPAKPAAAPVLEPRYTVLEDCNDTTNWATTDAGNTPIAQETAIKRIGSGSLKISISSGSSRGDRVYYDNTTGVDLSGVRQIAFWMRGTVTGALVAFGIGETSPAGAPFDYTWTIEVIEANTWQLVFVDLTDIADSSTTSGEGKDAIRYWGFEVLEDGSAATVYVDHIVYTGGLVGQYLYRYSYYNPTTGLEGESSSDALITVGDGQYQSVRLRMTTSGSAANDIKIYRKGGISSIWRHVATMDDSGSGVQTYTDTDAEHLLGAEEPTARGNPPSDARFIARFKNRMVYARTTTNPAKIWLSNYESPEVVPDLTLLETEPNAGGHIRVAHGEGDHIRGLCVFNDRLLIFKRNSIWALVGTNFLDFTLQSVTRDLGCMSHKSIAQYQNGIIWYTGKEIVLFDQSGFRVLSDAVQDHLDDVRDGYRNQSVGVIYNMRYYFFYTPTGQTRNTKCIVYDLRVQGWVELTGWEIQCALSLRGDSETWSLYCGDSASGFVWDSDTGFTDNTAAIPWLVQLGDFTGGNPVDEKVVTGYTLAVKNADELAVVEVDADQGRAKLQYVHSMRNERAGDEVPEQTLVRYRPRPAPGRQLRMELSGSADEEVALYRVEAEVRLVSNRAPVAG